MIRGLRPSRHGGARGIIVTVALVTLLPASIASQSPRLELDVSASRITYDTLAPLDAPSVSLLGEWRRPSLFARISGGATSFESAGWSVQGRAGLAGWLAPFGSLSPVRAEVGGAVTGSHHSQGFDTGVGRLDGRLHLVGRRAGVWAGASLARAGNSYDTVGVGAVMPGAGAWLQSGTMRAMLSYQHTRLEGTSFPTANVALTLTRGPLDMTLYGGAREWPGDGGFADERWVAAAAVYWISPQAALTVSGGEYAWDVVQGLPGGEFLSVGLRLTPRRTRPIPASALAPIVYTTEQARTGSIRFELDGASQVEIAGDWTGWRAVPLARNGSGWWILPADLEPGAYRFNIRIDGEEWMVPEGFPTVDDGFGGTVGLLIVSEADDGM